MFEFEAPDAVIVETKKILETALTTNDKTQSRLRRLIRKYVLEARKQVVVGIKFENGDPRHAARAVRTSVYKKILGANMNILNTKKAHGFNSYEPPRTLRQGQRGGNRVPRGESTNRRMHYAPLDRGFILRFVNSGTDDRTAGTSGGRLSGNRGAIAPRNFFRPLGDRAFGIMRDNLAAAIEAEVAKIMKSKP